jgi:hypothetical protein
MDYQDRSLILTIIGSLLLLVGVAAGLLGPAEMYCFYLFSEGGPFYYEGFGFGSFMFGNIACQIIGYYVIAAVFIPLGYGHLRGRRWARTLSSALLWSWLVVGLPLVVVFFLILVASKELSLTAVVVAVILLALSYLAAPGLLIPFYQSRGVRSTFEARDPRSYGFEGLPIPMLVLCSLYLFYAVVLHMPIFFNGIFPLFGTFLVEMDGILVLDALIALLLCLTWGTFRSRRWAWWGALLTFTALTLSTTVTFLQSSYMDILGSLNFPPTEMAFLDGVPLQGPHLAAFFGVPLLVTLGIIILSRRHFGAANRGLDR